MMVICLHRRFRAKALVHRANGTRFLPRPNDNCILELLHFAVEIEDLDPMIVRAFMTVQFICNNEAPL